MTSRILDNAEVSMWSDEADRTIPQIPHMDNPSEGVSAASLPGRRKTLYDLISTVPIRAATPDRVCCSAFAHAVNAMCFVRIQPILSNGDIRATRWALTR